MTTDPIEDEETKPSTTTPSEAGTETDPPAKPKADDPNQEPRPIGDTEGGVN